MGVELEYVFFAIDKPLSRRAAPTGRQVTFSYHVDGYDIPSGHHSLLAKYYDVMVRCEYEVWTIGMSFVYSKEVLECLQLFACDGYSYKRIEVSIAKEKRDTTKQILVEVHFQNDKTYGLNLGAPDFPWERSEDDNEEDDFAWYGDGEELMCQLAQVLAAIRSKIMDNGDCLGLYVAWDKLYAPDEDEIEREFLPAKPKNYAKVSNF